jgi:hypothetical protein
MEDSWYQSRETVVGGHRIRALSPEDLVLYLCLQADNHGTFNTAAVDALAAEEILFAHWSNNRIIRFTDVYETLRHYRQSLDWAQIVAGARAAGIDAAVRTTLKLTNALLGTIAPDEVCDDLRNGPEQKVRRWFAHAMVPELRGGTIGGMRRVAAASIRLLAPYWQIRLSRFIGLAELTFPSAAALRRRYRVRGRLALATVAVWHSSSSLLRTAAALLLRSLTSGTRGT